MGSQIGAEYALAGHDVVFYVRNLERARQRVAAAYALATEMERWTPERVAAARRRTGYATNLEEIDQQPDVFVESIVEDPAAKAQVLKAAARQFPDAILASNTSSISIGKLGGWAGAPHRTLGAHFWNPPLLMPLVEIIKAFETDQEHVETMISIIRDIGKRPVLVDRDVDGFVWNRLQLALLREAVWLVENRVATPETVDEIVRDGLARRWRYTGPFETASLGGPSTFTRVANNLWPVLSNAHELRDLGRWLIDDKALLEQIKRRRDAGLLEDLRKDATSQPGGER
jgi:3-hydroxybutyryl-CoA dehydrogenase